MDANDRPTDEELRRLTGISAGMERLMDARAARDVAVERARILDDLYRDNGPEVTP